MFFALVIALDIISIFSCLNNVAIALSDDEIGLVLAKFLSGGFKKGRADEGALRDDFFLLLLGILEQNCAFKYLERKYLLHFILSQCYLTFN